MYLYLCFLFLLEKCYSLGNFNNFDSDFIITEMTSIEKEPLSDEICKTLVKAYSINDFRNFICTDFRLEEKVRNIQISYISKNENHE